MELRKLEFGSWQASGIGEIRGELSLQGRPRYLESLLEGRCISGVPKARFGADCIVGKSFEAE